jgi:hypothetical protein
MGDDIPVIFLARNAHLAESGQPPVVETGPDQYTSYFENEHGEQWIFVRQQGAPTATVYGAHIGWEAPRTMSSTPEMREDHWSAAGLVLTMAEALWLAACWAASQPMGK